MAERRAVLITRPEPDASHTADLVAARGFDPVVAPVIAVRPRKLAGGTAYDAVAVSSRNAVQALPPDLHSLPLLAVGSATAERARQAGFTSVLDADGDAHALAALVRRTLPPGATLLYAHGAGQGAEFAEALAGSGLRVTCRAAYGIVAARRLPAPARDALRADRLRTAIFLSAETARAFARLMPDDLLPHLAEVDAAAIGGKAADALALLPWRRVRVSLRPRLDEVLALL